MFDKVSSKVGSKIGSTIGSNKKLIEKFLVVLILLEFAPFDVLNVVHPDADRHVRRVLAPVINPVTNLMSNVYMRTLVFLVLVWSCCMMKDMNLFFLVCVYFIVSRRG
jgi:hypothetical protein